MPTRRINLVTALRPERAKSAPHRPYLLSVPSRYARYLVLGRTYQTQTPTRKPLALFNLPKDLGDQKRRTKLLTQPLPPRIYVIRVKADDVSGNIVWGIIRYGVSLSKVCSH